MTTWHNLPSELHHLILYYFCASLIEDLTILGENVWDYIDPNYVWDHDLVEWSKSPPSLSSYFSALQTCRLFHTIITGAVSINSESVPDALQRIQRKNIEKILETLYDEVSSDIVHVNLFFFAAGRFWRNPKVVGEVNLLMKVLLWISQTSRLMLIPHLESWLLHHARKATIGDRNIEVLPIDEGHEDFVFAFLKTGSLNVKLDELVVSKVARRAEIYDSESEDLDVLPPCDPELPLLRDIREAKPDSWWLFPSYNMSSNDDDDDWTLVDFRQQKLYSGPDGTSSYCWREGVWDVNRWSRNNAINTLDDSSAL